jgi:hypothetical protein
LNNFIDINWFGNLQEAPAIPQPVEPIEPLDLPSQTYQPEPTESTQSTLPKIRLVLNRKSYTLPTTSITLPTLLSQIRPLLSPCPQSIPIFFKPDTELTPIESTSDLTSALNHASNISAPLVLILFPFSRTLRTPQHSQSSSEEDSPQTQNPELTLDESKTIIIREGYVYVQMWVGNTGGVMYHWEDRKTKRWAGRWAVDRFLTGGEYGKMASEHSVSMGDHSSNWKVRTRIKMAVGQSVGRGESEMELSIKEIRDFVKELYRRDPWLSHSQALFILKRTFPNTTLPNPKAIRNILYGARDFEMIDTIGMHNLGRMLTIDNKPFGRGMTFSLIDGVPKHFLYFYSDWQKQVVDEVKVQPNVHLFIDGTFKWCPKIWSQLLNIAVYHRGKQMYIPVGHVLMQTKMKQGYEAWIRWFKERLGLIADFITTDFEPALMDSSKSIFPNSQLVPWFFHFTKALWMEASRWGMKKRSLLKDSKMLLFQIKKLAFLPKESVFKRFLLIKDQWANKAQPFLKFLEYFEAIWLDGRYKIEDWNYYDKLAEFEDLALTNNGLESFHSSIKSQLHRVTPNLPGFLETLKRVEAIKKADYESDHITGDAQFNRWWPATKIMRELYCNKDEKTEEEKIAQKKKRIIKAINKSQDSQEEEKGESDCLEKTLDQIENLFTEFDDSYILQDTKYSLPNSHNQRKQIEHSLIKDELWNKINIVRKRKLTGAKK